MRLPSRCFSLGVCVDVEASDGLTMATPSSSAVADGDGAATVVASSGTRAGPSGEEPGGRTKPPVKAGRSPSA